MAAPSKIITVAAALRSGAARLQNATQSPALDARVLLGHSLDQSAAWLIAHADDALTAAARADYDRLVARRAGGEPLAYILGRREFWSLDVCVSPATLIPRPDTETLVSQALALGRDRHNARFLDLGTGSGAVALAIASESRDATVVATDRSEAALDVARDNAARLGLDVTFYLGDWFAALPEAPAPRFDVIVSNPPYVRDDDPHLARGDLPFEPRDALVAGADGLDALRQIVAEAAAHLRERGALALEHGADQGDAVRDLMQQQGWRDVETVRDLAGQPRVTLGRRR